MKIKRHRCVRCGKMTEKWQRINGSHWHCYDGCYSTTGWDYRQPDGIPSWLKSKTKDSNGTVY
jgi:ribosomal protein L37AE/L43A